MRCRACDTVWLVSGPPPSSSKRAAVVKRGADREKRDLFASRPPELGSVKQTMVPPPPTGGGGVGARNENSVLFRVDQLTGAGRVKTPEPEPVAVASAQLPDDEGIIDLKALSTAPPKPGARPLAPLFPSEPPIGFTRDASSSDAAPQRPAASSRMKLIAGIAAAAAVVVFAGIGLAVAFGGEEPVPRVAAAPAPPPAPAPVVTTAAPTSEPAPATTTASNSASSDDEDDAKPAARGGKKGKGKGKGGKGKKAAAAKGAAAAPAAAKPQKPPKAADPCHCKGDFNCILACTAKGHK